MKGLRTSWSAENVTVTVLIIGLAVYPLMASTYRVLNTAYFLTTALLSLSLALIWGYGGIFSFGQSAFFGIGAYVYGMLGLNVQSPGFTPVALLIAMLITGTVALILGYFMFYGGVNDVFVGLITLAFTLVLETFMAQTAGDQWRVGKALLGGFNGMNNIPPLSIGFGDHVFTFANTSFFYLVLVLFAVVYLFLRRLVASRWGYGLIAVRENRERTETFGYDIRKIQTLVFALGGMVAGLAGILYASWGGYITPSSMGMTSAAMPVILVAAGGRKNLTAATVSTLILSWFSQQMSITGSQYALVALGALLVVVILFAPEGAITGVFQWIDRWIVALRQAKHPGAGTRKDEAYGHRVD